MDNEENKQNIPTGQIILDQEEREIMWPSPSAEQDFLWDELYSAVSDQDLLREIKWFSVPDAVRKYLASKEISDKIKKIGGKFNLNNYQINELAKNIKYVFIKELLLTDFIVKFAEELKIERKLANQIGQEIKNEIFIPQKEYLLKLYPPAGVPPSGIMGGKPAVSFKPPVFKKEAESMRESPLFPIKKESVIKKEEPLMKFKAASDTSVHSSQGVSLDHLYEKLKSAKEERKEFLEEVVVKKEEELPKVWQMAPSIKTDESKNIDTEKQDIKIEIPKDIKIEKQKDEKIEINKDLKNEEQKPFELAKKSSAVSSSLKTADGGSKILEGKPPMRTMKKDIERIKIKK